MRVEGGFELFGVVEVVVCEDGVQVVVNWVGGRRHGHGGRGWGSEERVLGENQTVRFEICLVRYEIV